MNCKSSTSTSRNEAVNVLFILKRERIITCGINAAMRIGSTNFSGIHFLKMGCWLCIELFLQFYNQVQNIHAKVFLIKIIIMISWLTYLKSRKESCLRKSDWLKSDSELQIVNRWFILSYNKLKINKIQLIFITMKIIFSLIYFDGKLKVLSIQTSLLIENKICSFTPFTICNHYLNLSFSLKRL